MRSGRKSVIQEWDFQAEFNNPLSQIIWFLIRIAILEFIL
jgi:hypothetical protein